MKAYTFDVSVKVTIPDDEEESIAHDVAWLTLNHLARGLNRKYPDGTVVSVVEISDGEELL